MPSAYTRLVSGLVFPLHERLKGHGTLSVRRRMEEMQWWSSQDLAKYRNAELAKFIHHAVEHVPYYRDLFGHLGLSATDIRAEVDLRKIPFLTKAMIREHSQALKAGDAGATTPCSTGGSTGEPLTFLIGHERVSHDVAAKWRATRWWGVDIGDRRSRRMGFSDRVRRTGSTLGVFVIECCAAGCCPRSR